MLGQEGLRCGCLGFLPPHPIPHIPPQAQAAPLAGPPLRPVGFPPGVPEPQSVTWEEEPTKVQAVDAMAVAGFVWVDVALPRQNVAFVTLPHCPSPDALFWVSV